MPIAPNSVRTIRAATFEDKPALLRLLPDIGLFSNSELDEVSATLDRHFNPESRADDQWIVADEGGSLTGVAYFAPERLTDRTWNLYLIGVHPRQQRQGLATVLIRHVEQYLKTRHARILLVETASGGAQIGARALYRKYGFDEEGRIRDFYKEGEDKVIFRKPLINAAQSSERTGK